MTRAAVAAKEHPGRRGRSVDRPLSRAGGVIASKPMSDDLEDGGVPVGVNGGLDSFENGGKHPSETAAKEGANGKEDFEWPDDVF